MPLSDLIRAIDLRIERYASENSTLRYGTVSAVQDNYYLIRLDGSKEVYQAQLAKGLAANVGDNILAVKPTRTRTWLITAVFKQQEDLQPAVQASLVQPSTVAAAALPGQILLTWAAPVHVIPSYHIQHNSSAAEAGAVNVYVHGTQFIYQPAAGAELAARYFRVRMVGTNLRVSAWTSWVSATPGLITDGTTNYPFRTTLNFLGAAITDNTTELEIVAGGEASVDDRRVKVSSNDAAPDFLGAKLTAGTNVVLTELNDGGAETVKIDASGGGGDTVKVSANDTTAGYLGAKLAAGDNVTLTELNDGQNETLRISASGGAGGEVSPWLVQGRLCMDPATPWVPVSTAADSLYYVPVIGNQIALYNGESWQAVTIPYSGLQISCAGFSANTNYDVFLYINNGQLAAETVAWSTDTARVNELDWFDNRWETKSGDATRRYVGTVRAPEAGKIVDGTRQFFLWNQFNRYERNWYNSATNKTITSTTGEFWDSTFMRLELVQGNSNLFPENALIHFRLWMRLQHTTSYRPLNVGVNTGTSANTSTILPAMHAAGGEANTLGYVSTRLFTDTWGYKRYNVIAWTASTPGSVNPVVNAFYINVQFKA